MLYHYIKIQTLIALLVVAIFLISCTPSAKVAARKTFANNGTIPISAIPDSVLQNKGITKIILSPGWIMEGPLSGPDAPARNNITVLPDGICQLKKLTVLYLAMNDIKELPACFDELQHLEMLDLSYNPSFNIRTALPILLRLKRLKDLNLYGIKSVVELEPMIRKELEKRKISMILTREDMWKRVEHK